jgi:hypothetical protein
MQATELIVATTIDPTRNGLELQVGEKIVRIPWERCSERLSAATEQERLTVELSPSGYGIHWPLIDEDLSIQGLLRDYEQSGQVVTARRAVRGGLAETALPFLKKSGGGV